MPASHSIQNCSGFTRKEMLAGIAVIAILAALLFPAINVVIQKSRQTRCVGNLQTWGTAIKAYAQDHNGDVVWDDWQDISTPKRFYEAYLGGDKTTKTMSMDGTPAFATQYYRRCPTQVWDKSTSANGPVGYGFIRSSPFVSSSPRYNLASAKSPSQLLVLIEATDLNLRGSSELESKVKPLCTGDNPRHRGSINALFGDGHVASYAWAQIDGDTPEEKAMVTQWFKLK